MEIYGVSESESDDASEVCVIKTSLDDSMKKLVQKKRKSVNAHGWLIQKPLTCNIGRADGLYRSHSRVL